MKINTKHFFSGFCTSLVVVGILVTWGAMGRTLAQNTLPNFNQSDLNGLFTPTSSQRFFEEGRRNFSREVEILANPERYYDGSLLQINTIDIDVEVIDERGEIKTIPDFSTNYLQQKTD